MPDALKRFRHLYTERVVVPVDVATASTVSPLLLKRMILARNARLCGVLEDRIKVSSAFRSDADIS
jgi:hypothetical protein